LYYPHIILVSILYSSRGFLIFFLLVFSRISFYFLMVTIKRLYIRDYMSELKVVNLTFFIFFTILFYFTFLFIFKLRVRIYHDITNCHTTVTKSHNNVTSHCHMIMCHKKHYKKCYKLHSTCISITSRLIFTN